MTTRVLSDLHCGPGLGPWEWSSQADIARQAAFLRATPASVERVVLAGDIFDTWVCPVGTRPPTMHDTMFAPSSWAAPLVNAIHYLAARTHVVYVAGNHDMGMTADLVDEALSGVDWVGNAFESEALRIEHGHMHALFCAPDPGVDDALPLGYFISRLAATADARTGGHSPTREAIVRELIEMGEHRETLPSALISVMASRASVGENDPILMPADIWGGRTTTLAECRSLYDALVGRWIVAHGALSLVSAIAAELGNLTTAAESMMGIARTIVMGHTHHSLKQAWGVWDGRVYANTGMWCQGVGTWIEIDGDDVTVHP